MRDFLGPVNAEQVTTTLGTIYVTPSEKTGIHVNAPHLSVDGVPLQASAFLVSDGQPFKFDLAQKYDRNPGRFFTDENALVARLVDGRDADLVTLGRIAQVLVPAVREFATAHQALILEAERRKIHNELATLERQIEDKRASVEEKERELSAVVEALKHTR